jgi:excisionase family DNA binding protein
VKKVEIEKQDEKYYVIAEIEEMLKASNSTVKRWIASGKLRAVKFGEDVKGNPWRISESALEDFKKKNSKYNSPSR